ncbi:MAG: NAD(P)-dependent oxidoreductase [SAR202 cluster bacterium]|jgi:D-3-phosphoglycerate dehydrogenase|nr:NAD(P)-dependent oxidoreductase [SAR202 cluster bacterium]MDP7533468.1 NAD(P)-dependent oxidoreductase [SAR202 cluster bacterium]HJO83600.1 NAD(P)-dependent oxidoreductase [SAR202 cluster bacterium]|tara:strand:- start:2181 stop:3155 length:975 start_codon:yes stop_codon:yes gene_type:complete
MSNSERLTFVAPGDDPPQLQGSAHADRLEPHGDLVMHLDRPSSYEEKIERVSNADIIINTRGAIDWPGEALRALPNLKMITTCSIGTDMIDLATASELGIVVSNQPGRTAPTVAEHMFGLMFAVAKRAAYQTAELKQVRWGRVINIHLQGKTVGVVGTGNVGAEFARLANAIRMKVLAWTFHPSDERGQRLGVEYVELDELLTRSDVVSLHVASSDQTRGMIGERELTLMKPEAILVNGARGDVVDTNALATLLNSGHLAGAAVDVFDEEPITPDNPLLTCEQVVLTPHMADMTPEGIEALNEGAVDNVLAYLAGNPQNVVASS